LRLNQQFCMNCLLVKIELNGDFSTQYCVSNNL